MNLARVKRMFQGRIGVAYFWKAIVFATAIALGLSIVFVLIFTTVLGSVFSPGSNMQTAVIVLFAGSIYVLYLAVATGLFVRRLHDLSLPGWIVLVFFVVGAIVKYLDHLGPHTLLVSALSSLSTIAWLLIALWPGKAGPNSYGVRPTYRSWWTALTATEESDTSSVAV